MRQTQSPYRQKTGDVQTVNCAKDKDINQKTRIVIITINARADQ